MAVGRVQHRLQRRARQPRGQDDHRGQPPVRAQRIEYRLDILDRAQDGRALHPPPRLPRPQGQDAGHPVGRAAVMRQGAQEDIGPLRRADQQDVLGVRRGVPGMAGGLQQRGDAPPPAAPPAPRHPHREGGIGRPPSPTKCKPAVNSAAASTAAPVTASKSRSPAKRQYCSGRRSGAPAAASASTAPGSAPAHQYPGGQAPGTAAHTAAGRAASASRLSSARFRTTRWDGPRAIRAL